MATSPDAQDQLQRLVQLLNVECRVSSDVTKYITNSPSDGGMGLSAIADFVGFFKEDEFEDGVQSEILAHLEKYKKDRLELSRLRTAYRLAAAEFQLVLKRKSDGEVGEDFDAPLDNAILTKAKSDWETAYHFRISEEFQPSDLLFARLYREFRKRCVSVYPLAKVRSAAQSPGLAAVQYQRISKDVSVAVNSQPAIVEISFETPMLLMWSLRIMVIGWARAGLTMVDDPAGKKVRDADLTDCLAYHDFVYTKILEHPGSAREVVAWVLDRDRQTRTKARALYMNAGFSWGQAVVESCEKHCAVLWTVTNSGPAAVLATSGGGSAGMDFETPAKRQRTRGAQTASQDDNGKKLCKKHNDSRGCAKRQKDCPDKAQHVCDAMKPDGKACLSFTHKRITPCPHLS